MWLPLWAVLLFSALFLVFVLLAIRLLFRCSDLETALILRYLTPDWEQGYSVQRQMERDTGVQINPGAFYTAVSCLEEEGRVVSEYREDDCGRCRYIRRIEPKERP